MPLCIPFLPSEFSPLARRKKHQASHVSHQRITTLSISAPIPKTTSMPSRSQSAAGSTHQLQPNRIVTGNRPEVTKAFVGNTIKRRPVPPLYPVPESMDFANAPVASPDAGSVHGTRRALGTRTSSAPFSSSQNDGETTARASTPKYSARFDPRKTIRNSLRVSKLGADVPLSVNESCQWKGKEKAEMVLYEDDNEERDQRSIMGHQRQSRILAKAKEIREWMKGKSGSEAHKPTTFSWRRDDPFPLHSATTTKSSRRAGGVECDLGQVQGEKSFVYPPPRAGQTYEIVAHRIVERNPDKTVEISTWRENTARETKAGEVAEKLDIYYISPEDNENVGLSASDTGPELEWRIMEAFDAPRTSIIRMNSENETDTVPNRSQNGRQESLKLDRRKSRQSTGHRRSVILHDTEGTISPTASEKEQDSDVADPGLNTANVHTFRQRGIPGTSTPVHRRDRNFQVRHSHSYTHNRHSRSTSQERTKDPTTIPQRDRELPRSATTSLNHHAPFHPTRSGSTISSIKSESTLELESILHTCEPSLAHIAPVLKRLGIRRLEHLKAVARLTPSTRDREVKEDALKLGISVMEWAIFVDKIFTL